MFIYQGNKHDCGFASLKMLLADVHHDSNYLYLDNEKKDEAYNLLELVNIAKKHNVTLVGKEIDIDSTVEYVKKHKTFLAVVEDELHNAHLVYVKGMMFNKVRVLDPNKGELLMDLVNFKGIFQRKVLEFDKGDFRKTKCPNKKKDIIPKWHLALLYSLTFLSMASIILAFTLIAYNIDFLSIALSLVSYIIFESAQRFASHVLLKKFDERYLKVFQEKPKEFIMESYPILIERKKYLFLTPIMLISDLVLSFSILFIFIINGKIYATILLGLWVLATVIEYLYYLVTKKKEDNVNIMENQLLDGKPIEIKNFVNDTYSIAGLFSIKRLLLILASVLGSIYLMIVTNNKTITFVLFYFVALYVALERFTSVVSTMLKNDKINRNESRFRDTFL